MPMKPIKRPKGVKGVAGKPMPAGARKDMYKKRMAGTAASPMGKTQPGKAGRMAGMAARMRKITGTKTAQAMMKSAKKDVGKASSSASIKDAGNASALARKKLLAANKIVKKSTK